MSEPRPRPLRVLETCLYARDLGAAADFYERVLGLDRVSEAEGRHVFFRCADAMVLLFDPDRTAVPDGDVPPHGARGPGHVAFAIREEEMAAWRARLRQGGVEIEQEVRWPGGGSSIYVRDPAGNSVELATAAIWRLP